MRLAVLILVLSVVVGTGTAHAQSGMSTTADGLTCNWSGSSGIYQVFCSGHSIRLNRFVSYSCDYFTYGGYSAQWSCRDIRGNTWSGSR